MILLPCCNLNMNYLTSINKKKTRTKKIRNGKE